MNAPNLAGVVGDNVRRLRESRQHTHSDTMRLIWERTGQVWSRSEVGILENGRRESVTVNDLATLACAFDVPMSAFLAGGGAVHMGDGFSVALDSLTGPNPPQRLDEPADPMGPAFAPWLIEADETVAERLGIARPKVTDTARRLWGGTATQERDRRLGDTGGVAPRSLQGRRGAMTRLLTAEIRAALA